jgi:ATP-dependent DNA helicase DinG
MHAHKYGEGLGEFDILVLDEAHSAEGELSKFVSVVLTTSDMMLIKGNPDLPDPSYTMEYWIQLAEQWLGSVTVRMEMLQQEIRDTRSVFQRVPRGRMNELRRLKNVQSKLAQLAGARGEWVLEYQSGRRGRQVKFDPIYPSAYSEQYLFLDVPKVVLSSATIRPKTLEILGIPEDTYDFKEYPSSFPVERRPVIHVSTAAMSMKADDAMRRAWHERIDQIIKWRQDRKGIIHTVSYDRARKIAAESEYRHLMMLNDPESTRDTVRDFKESKQPCILVSPSVTTGYDFPYDECEYIIISKVPFPPPTDAIIKARSERDRYYSHYLAVLEMVQMAGRGMRAEDDQCEIIVIDDQIIAPWFVKSLRNFSPDWFMQSFRSQRTPPPPLPKLPPRRIV